MRKLKKSFFPVSFRLLFWWECLPDSFFYICGTPLCNHALIWIQLDLRKTKSNQTGSNITITPTFNPWLPTSNQLTFVARSISLCKALQKQFLTYWADVYRKEFVRSNLISRALVNANVLSSFGEIRQITIQPKNTVPPLVQTERQEQKRKLIENNLYKECIPEDALLVWLLPETLSFQPSVTFYISLLNNPPDKRTWQVNVVADYCLCVQIRSLLLAIAL